MDRLKFALHEWTKIIGEKNVMVSASELENVANTTFITHARALAILSPANSDEVQRLIKIANQFKIPIYPVSRGRNCGYGSSVPYHDPSVILDLSRLNQIVDYDDELAFVRVQPGVTQEQLCDFLTRHGGKNWMDPIATFPDCSVLANVLERGHGLTAYGDRVASASDFEVILPTGEKISTGFSSLAGAKTAGLDRWAPGPQLDGIFSQSNFGVVTELTIWLMPKPECAEAIGFSVSSDENFARVIDRLRRFKLDETIRFGPRFFNEYRLIETYSRYPWERMKGVTPLSEECVQSIRQDLGIPRWTGVVGFFGSPEQVGASQAKTIAALAGVVEKTLLLNKEIVKGQAPRDVFERFLHSAFHGMTGHVGPVTQRPRWRKKRGAEHGDWSIDSCGIIWLPVSVPFRGSDACKAVGIYRKIISEFGYEPDMSVSSIRSRTLEINASIIFDRADDLQDRQAIPCARRTLVELADNGYYPHRLGIPTMPLMDHMDPQTREVLSKIKKALDPNGILAPGRYVK